MKDIPTNSRFYAPCLQALQENSPASMGVSEIIKSVWQKNPALNFSSSNGGVRAILLKMAMSNDSPIKLEKDSQPPRFYVENPTPSPSIAPKKSPSDTHKTTSNSMFYEPCCELLKECTPNAMSANELTKAIIERFPELEWSHSQGPVRAMLLKAASLERSPIQCKENTQPPLFYYKATGISGNDMVVEASAEEIMGNAFAKTQAVLKENLMEKIRSLSPTAFEHLANSLVAKMLFGKAEDTTPSGDGGLDGFIHIYADPLGINTIGVQAKHYLEGNVPAPDIQKFVGALHGMNGVFVTCAKFSKGAMDEARLSKFCKIVLINGEQLVDYMTEYRVGVRETGISYALAEINEEFFEEL